MGQRKEMSLAIYLARTSRLQGQVKWPFWDNGHMPQEGESRRLPTFRKCGKRHAEICLIGTHICFKCGKDLRFEIALGKTHLIILQPLTSYL